MNLHDEARHLANMLPTPVLADIDGDGRILIGKLIDNGNDGWGHLSSGERDLLKVAYLMSRLGDAFNGARFDDQLRRNAGYCLAEGADVIVRCGQLEADDGPF